MCDASGHHHGDADFLICRHICTSFHNFFHFVSQFFFCLNLFWLSFLFFRLLYISGRMQNEAYGHFNDGFSINSGPSKHTACHQFRIERNSMLFHFDEWLTTDAVCQAYLHSNCLISILHVRHHRKLDRYFQSKWKWNPLPNNKLECFETLSCYFQKVLRKSRCAVQ